jgi:hypothetical protein
MSSRKRRRFFGATGRFLLALIVHCLRWGVCGTLRQFDMEGRLQQTLLSRAQIRRFPLVVERHQPDLRAGRDVVADDPEAATLALAPTTVGP